MNEFQKTPSASVKKDNYSVNKTPFLVADVVLIAAAILILYFVRPLTGAACWCISLLIGGGAWASIWPWMQEERTKAALSELDGTKNIEDNVCKMGTFAQEINTSLTALENAQKAIESTTKAFSSVDEKMATNTKDWEERVAKAAQYEKNTFILEVNKLRQEEKAWSETVMGLLDHILGFTGAGLASGQPQIVEQMSRFRRACLDISSRIGILPILPAMDEPFNPDKHRLPPNAPKTEPGCKIIHVLAPGYQYQGQVVCKTTVLVEGMTLSRNSDNSLGRDISTSNTTLTSSANTTTLSSSNDITEPVPTANPQEPQAEGSAGSASFTPAEPLHDEDKAEEKNKTEPSDLTDQSPADSSEDTEAPEEMQPETEKTSEKNSEESDLDDADLFRQETFESIPPQIKTDEDTNAEIKTEEPVSPSETQPGKEEPVKHGDPMLPFAEQGRKNDDQLPL